MHAMKLGKAPAVRDSRDLLFSNYRVPGAPLPPHPRQFGHEKLVPDWGMCANDTVGCCVLACAAHDTKLWNAERGVTVDFTDKDVLSDYSAVTGYVPGDETTDQGTNMRDALNYRRKTGVVDATGKRHKIGAFVALNPGDVDELLEAIWLFGAVDLGFQMPSSAMDQTNAGKPWSVVQRSPIEGGHCVNGVACRGTGMLSFLGVSRDLVVTTWGQLQAVTLPFYTRFCDEACAILSDERIGSSGKSLEGFDMDALRADLARVAT